MHKRLLQPLLFGSTVAGLLLILPARAQTTASGSPQPSGQIGPGTAGSISPAQGVASSGSATTKKMLAGALTPKTRQTLQEAMDSEMGGDSSTGREITLGPGEAAQMDGTSAAKVAFDSLPSPVKNALRSATHDTLRSGAH